MKGKPTQEIIRPAAYDSEAASRSGIMQRLSGGGTSVRTNSRSPDRCLRSAGSHAADAGSTGCY